jgi:methionyl-tRNA formyltransferase
VAEGAPLRVAFAGTPEFARQALAAVLRAGHAVPLVLTQPDRPAGRGLKLHPSPVKQLALERALAVAQPAGLRLNGRHAADAAAAQAALAAAAPDVMVVAAYGLILPDWVLQLPRLGCLNIHASLLPRWRGAAPVQRAIEAGDAVTGVTIMQMDAGLDTGAMLAVERLPIAADDTAATLTARLAELGAGAIVAALRDAAAGRLHAVPQPDEGVTYAHKIDKAEAALDWSAPATLLERRLRAFDPFPGATGTLGGVALKLWRAEVVAWPGTAGAAPGTTRGDGAGGLVTACGEGALRWTEVQLPGGRRIGTRELLQRHPELAG